MKSPESGTRATTEMLGAKPNTALPLQPTNVDPIPSKAQKGLSFFTDMAMMGVKLAEDWAISEAKANVPENAKIYRPAVCLLCPALPPRLAAGPLRFGPLRCGPGNP